MAPIEKFTRVDGLRIRYLEEGGGNAVLLLHGASLGSSADVWDATLLPLAAYGFRVIAFDQPGFGLSDNPDDYSVAYRHESILKFMDALGLDSSYVVGHSQAGNMAVSLAFEYPRRFPKVVTVGTGSLLPPLPGGREQTGPIEGEEGTVSEPTLDDTRAQLEANLFHHSLITQEAVERRNRMSIGKNFQASLQRNRAPRIGGKDSVPLWQRLGQIPVPLLLIYGRDDRGSVAERARLAKEQFPSLNLHLFDDCKHLVQWDRAAEFVALTGRFVAS